MHTKQASRGATEDVVLPKLPRERWNTFEYDGLNKKSFAMSLWHVIALRDAEDACSLQGLPLRVCL
jgi:hypothetical protein